MKESYFSRCTFFPVGWSVSLLFNGFVWWPKNCAFITLMPCYEKDDDDNFMIWIAGTRGAVHNPAATIHFILCTGLPWWCLMTAHLAKIACLKLNPETTSEKAKNYWYAIVCHHYFNSPNFELVNVNAHLGPWTYSILCFRCSLSSKLWILQ